MLIYVIIKLRDIKEAGEMSYTYVINNDPTGEDLKTLCKRIDELCPGYERAGGRKYADGGENVRWEKGELVITAEWVPSGVMTVRTDEALPALEREYSPKKIAQKDHDIRDAFSYIGRVTGDLLSGTPARVKFIFLPCLVILLLLVPAVLESDPGAVPAAVYLLGELGSMLGLVWLIPAGAAAVFMAEQKSSFGVKAVTAAMPVICTAYGCRWYELHDHIDDLRFYLLLAAAILPVALPFLMIDEIACIRLKRVTGSRPGARTGAVCWIISIVLSAGVMGLEYHLMNWDRDYFTSDIYYALTAAYERYDEAQGELIYMRYGNDISDIVRYAAENNYYNWTECPDRSLEGQWRRVFSEAGADCEVEVCEGGAVFKFPGIGHEVKVAAGGSPDRYGSGHAQIPVTLSKGVCRLTADVDGVKTYTEFYSR